MDEKSLNAIEYAPELLILSLRLSCLWTDSTFLVAITEEPLECNVFRVSGIECVPGVFLWMIVGEIFTRGGGESGGLRVFGDLNGNFGSTCEFCALTFIT